MFIKKIQLTKYRNYDYETFEFTNGINVLKGDNAQGKTNCVEAVFYLCTGYSPRVGKDRQLIKEGEEWGSISATASGVYGEVNVEARFSKTEAKVIKVNGVPISKIGELMGNINSVFFNPSGLKLIQESPEDRRRFMDIALSQISRKYFYSLQKYKKILEQRNVLLKNIDREVIFETLPLWDRELCKSAATIIFERNLFISELAPEAQKCHAYITDGKENLEILFDHEYTGGIVEIEESLYNAMREREEKDIETGYTTLGPHRDDLKIKLNGVDVRVYGSQGQQRSAALSMKLGEMEVFNNRFGEYPTLILDDALSELDRNRQKRLIKFIEDKQVLITLAELNKEVFEGVDYNLISIENGKIVD